MITAYLVGVDHDGVLELPVSSIYAVLRHPVIHRDGLGDAVFRAYTQTCDIPLNSVCSHGWLCTSDIKIAQMIVDLRKEPDAMLTFLARRLMQRPLDGGALLLGELHEWCDQRRQGRIS